MQDLLARDLHGNWKELQSGSLFCLKGNLLDFILLPKKDIHDACSDSHFVLMCLLVFVPGDPVPPGPWPVLLQLFLEQMRPESQELPLRPRCGAGFPVPWCWFVNRSPCFCFLVVVSTKHRQRRWEHTSGQQQ